jgi:hypothetical protein
VANDFSKLRAIHAVMGMDCPYSDAERLVAVVLILDRDDAKAGAYRGQSGIAARAGLSRRTAQRALTSLVERGDGPLFVTALAQGRNDGSGGRAPNLYSVELRASVAHKGEGGSRQPGAQPEGDLCAKSEGVVRQNEGGLCVTVTQDLSSDLSSDLKRSVSTSETAPLVLVPSTRKPAAKPVPKRSGTNGRPKADRSDEARRAHAHLVAVYFEAYEGCVGCKPAFKDREGNAVWKLYDAVGVERGERCLRNAFSDDWGARRSILTVAADPSKFMAPAPRKSNGRHAPQQADVVSVREVMAAHRESF